MNNILSRIFQKAIIRSKNKTIQRQVQNQPAQKQNQEPTPQSQNQPSPSADKNTVTTQTVMTKLGNSCDIVKRQVYINSNKALPVTLFFIDGLSGQDKISDFILKPLSENELLKDVKDEKEAVIKILDGAVYFATIKALEQLDDVIHALMNGYCALVFDKEKKAIAFETKGYERRSISPPAEEPAIRGAKTSFVEDIRMNTAMLRLSIKNPNLSIEEMIIGRQSKTTINILYMQNICNPKFVEEIRNKLNSISADRIMYLSDIITYLSDRKFTIVPVIQITEKPDAVSASLLEGKVAIIADGIPYALVMPLVINDIFHVPSDYNLNYMVVSMFRILSYVLVFITILLPGFYVALTSYHGEMIPRSLLYAIAGSKVNTPFPIYLEVLLMLLTFFTLIQASTRTPGNISATVAIVGGLVLGEAAISAQLVSPMVVVIVAGSAISSLAIPNKEANFSMWLLMIVNVIIAAMFGLFGLALGVLVGLYHLASIEVLGVPYLSPYSGAKKFQIGDSLIRFPQFLLKNRPYYLQPKNKRRKP